MSEDTFRRLHESKGARIAHNTEALRQAKAGEPSVEPVDGVCPDGYMMDPDGTGRCSPADSDPNDSRPATPASSKSRALLEEIRGEMKANRGLVERLVQLKSAERLGELRSALDDGPKAALRFVNKALAARGSSAHELLDTIDITMKLMASRRPRILEQVDRVVRPRRPRVLEALEREFRRRRG